MSFSIRSAFVDGFPRAFRRSGWILISAYLLSVFIQTGLAWMISNAVLPLGNSAVPVSGGWMPAPGAQLPPVVEFLSFLIALFSGTLLTAPVLVVADRTLVSKFTDCIPEEFVFHRLGWATVNSFLASLVLLCSIGVVTAVLFGLAGWGLVIMPDQLLLDQLLGTTLGRTVLIGIGLVLLLPGAFLGASLTFVGQEIAVKDKNVIEALVGSWQLARHNRLRLFVLVFIAFISQIGISFLSELSGLISAQVGSIAGAAILQIVWLSIMARAYVQLHNGDGIIDNVAPLLTGQYGFEQRQ